MEHPVPLKKDRKSKQAKNACGSKMCIIHFESTVGEEIGSLTETGFSKIQEVAKKRLSYVSTKDRLEHISSAIPDELDPSKHGTHRRCYQSFTNISRIQKRTSETSESQASSSKRRRSSTDLSCSTVLFPTSQCLFCDKETIKVKGIKQKLVKCVTKCAEESIRLAAARSCDEKISCKILGQDLVAREAYYHNACRRKYTRSEARHVPHEDSESSKSQAAHNDAFQFLSCYVEEQIIEGQNVERLTMLRERYLNYLLEKYPAVYNESYKTYKLKDKLIKHYQNRIRFWRPTSSRTTSELVYSADVEGSAVETAFELASSDERRLVESAMILRRHINDARRMSSDMP